MNELQLLITLKDQASKGLQALGSTAGSVADQVVKHWERMVAAAATFTAGLEVLQRHQAEYTRDVGELSAATGIQGDRLRSLAAGLANVDTPLQEVLATLKEGTKEGLTSEVALLRYQEAWDKVADATKIAGDVLAQKGVALKTVGIDANNVTAAENALGFVQTQTTLGVEGFLDLLARKGGQARAFGLDINDTAALLAVMQRELGYTGRALISEFDQALSSSDGTLNGVLARLGVSIETYQRYRTSVEGGAQALDKLAEANTRAYTPLQQLKQKIDEVIFQNPQLLEQSASWATIAGGMLSVSAILVKVASGITAIVGAASAAVVALVAIPAAILAIIGIEQHWAVSQAKARDELEATRRAGELLASQSQAQISAQIPLIEQQITALQARREEMLRQLDTGDLTGQQILELRDRINDLTNNINSQNKDLAGHKAALGQSADAMAAASKVAADTAKSYNDVALAIANMSAEAYASAAAVAAVKMPVGNEEEAAAALARVTSATDAVNARLAQERDAAAIKARILDAADPGGALRKQIAASNSSSNASGGAAKLGDAQKALADIRAKQEEALDAAYVKGGAAAVDALRKVQQAQDDAWTRMKEQALRDGYTLSDTAREAWQRVLDDQTDTNQKLSDLMAKAHTDQIASEAATQKALAEARAKDAASLFATLTGGMGSQASLASRLGALNIANAAANGLTGSTDSKGNFVDSRGRVGTVDSHGVFSSVDASPAVHIENYGHVNVVSPGSGSTGASVPALVTS